jgi:transcriptional regulator with XRE-family HTH domain
MMAKKKKPGIDDQLREAIKATGLSANAIANATGVPQTTVSRFLNGKNLGLGRASSIAEYLGLELRPKR